MTILNLYIYIEVQKGEGPLDRCSAGSLRSSEGRRLQIVHNSIRNLYFSQVTMMIFQILALVALFLAAVSADGNFDENDKFSTPLSERDMVLGTSLKE